MQSDTQRERLLSPGGERAQQVDVVPVQTKTKDAVGEDRRRVSAHNKTTGCVRCTHLWSHRSGWKS